MQLRAGVVRARSGSRRGSRPSACRSSARTPAPAGRPPPSRRRRGSAWSGRSTSSCRSRRTRGGPRAARAGVELLRAAGGWACRRRPCWSSMKTKVASGHDRARRLEQVERAVGVDAEVRLRARAPPSRGRAARRCGRPARCRAASSAKALRRRSASRMSSLEPAELVDSVAIELARSRARSRPRGRRTGPACRSRGRSRPSRPRPGAATRLRADQAPRTGDDRDAASVHPCPRRARAPRRSASLVLADPAADVRERSRAGPARAPVRALEEPRAVGDVDRARRPAGSPAPRSIGTSLPVSSRQSSVVSSSERLQSAPAADVARQPAQRSGRASCSSTRSTRSSTCSRSRTCLPAPP